MTWKEIQAPVLVVAWWFIATGTYGEHTHGPFSDKVQCELIRAEAERLSPKLTKHTQCWWDGRGLGQ